jgi:ankyrin repeat protein
VYKTTCGADLTVRDRKGYTPLMSACRWGTPELVELLLSHGAFLHGRGNNGETVLTLSYDPRIKDIVSEHISSLFTRKKGVPNSYGDISIVEGS